MSFQHYFYPNRDEIGRESEKTIFFLNSVPTLPGRENSKKLKKAKKLKKIKKHHSSIISIQNEMRLAEKERKENLVPNSVPTRPRL